MRLPCPFCGERDVSEFVCRGEAGPVRPDPAGADPGPAMFEYLYPRANPAGPTVEHWYHAYGCRRWLRVERDSRTHAVHGARFAQGARA